MWALKLLIYTTAFGGKTASSYASRLNLSLPESHLYSETSSSMVAENLVPVVIILTS